MSEAVIVYLTDIEGRWEKLEQALEGCGALRLEGRRLELAPHATFVYGGDAVDRGRDSLRLVEALVEAHSRWPERVVLLAGNRDINKLRLPRELGLYPPPGAPEPLPERLRHILARTMGAPEAYGHRQAELGDVDDNAVLASFLAEVRPPEGPLYRLLCASRLGWRWGDVLFLHGGPTLENLHLVPGAPPAPDLEAWLAALDRFLHAQLRAYAADAVGTSHHALVAYQAPLPGTRANARSVVYSRPVNQRGEPEPLVPALRVALLAQGIRRLVVGHTPTGDCPSLLVDEGLQLLMVDTSYSPLERGARLELYADRSRFVGHALVDGEICAIDQEIPLDPPAPLGRRVDGWLVKAALPQGWLGFRMAEGFRPVQTCLRGELLSP
jgi:hypothetical protein